MPQRTAAPGLRQPTVSLLETWRAPSSMQLCNTEICRLLVAAALLQPLACDRSEPPGAEPSSRVSSPPPSSSSVPERPVPSAPREPVEPAAQASGAAGAVASGATEPPSPPPPHPGPWLTILQPSVAIYSDANPERSNKLGYAQSGARLAVTGQPKPGERCNSGWMQVVPTGYVCTVAGTLDEKDGRIKFTLKAPALDGTLPYTYARNAKNGTPLYRSIPTRAQMLEYEPYLRKEPELPPTDPSSVVPGAASATVAPTVTPSPSGTSVPTANASSAPPTVPPSPADGLAKPAPSVVDDRPWWQQEGIEERLHELRLSDLHGESDGVLAMRMVKGFYVAVDRTFHWNGRLWYKTTKGLVAPADRMGQASPSDFHGVELGPDWHMPVGWVFGGREKTTTYEIDVDKERIKVAGSVPRFEALQLTDRRAEIKGTIYQELASGKWVKRDHLRIPEPGNPPTDLKDHERWVDVDLSTQSLVVYEGVTPIYATLISSGKSSKIKDKDHATPTGQWRIREKHLTTTMDGDGSAAGDLPYSIEDVPYVMYFHKSYAIHGAFWHRNYGMQMSHGCVNLSPLDAKAVFMKTEPSLPDGWHGAWSNPNKPGSWVVVHD